MDISAHGAPLWTSDFKSTNWIEFCKIFFEREMNGKCTDYAVLNCQDEQSTYLHVHHDLEYFINNFVMNNICKTRMFFLFLNKYKGYEYYYQVIVV